MVDVNLKVPALEKLVDYARPAASARWQGPMLATWKSAPRREGECSSGCRPRRTACGSSPMPKLMRDVPSPWPDDDGSTECWKSARRGLRQRIEFQEKEAAGEHRVRWSASAAAGLGDKEVPDREPDPDWTARFFEDVSKIYLPKNMQKIWEKNTRREKWKTPGRTSLRTLTRF